MVTSKRGADSLSSRLIVDCKVDLSGGNAGVAELVLQLRDTQALEQYFDGPPCPSKKVRRATATELALEFGGEPRRNAVFRAVAKSYENV